MLTQNCSETLVLNPKYIYCDMQKKSHSSDVPLIISVVQGLLVKSHTSQPPPVQVTISTDPAQRHYRRKHGAFGPGPSLHHPTPVHQDAIYQYALKLITHKSRDRLYGSCQILCRVNKVVFFAAGTSIICLRFWKKIDLMLQ